MKTRKVICSALGLYALALFIASCTGDETENNTGEEHGEPMSFEVKTEINWNTPKPGWNNANSAPKDGTRAVDTIPGQVITLQGKNPTDKLYMRLMVSDWDNELSDLQQQCLTRGVIIRDSLHFYSSFGLLARITENNWPSKPTTNYLNNVEIKGRSDGYWRPDETIFWPGKGWKIRMMAYAPYNATGLSFDESNVYRLNYNVPADATKQADLMIALSNDLTGNYNRPFKFQFQHILAAVRFVAGDGISPDELKSVTLKNIYHKLFYKLDEDAWYHQEQDGDSKIDFSQEFDNEDYQTSAGDDIREWAATFMMAPVAQTINESLVEVTLTSGEVLKSPNGLSWKQNTIYTYHITRGEP